MRKRPSFSGRFDGAEPRFLPQSSPTVVLFVHWGHEVSIDTPYCESSKHLTPHYFIVRCMLSVRPKDHYSAPQTSVLTLLLL